MSIIVTFHPQGTVDPFTAAGVEPTQRGGRPTTSAKTSTDPLHCTCPVHQEARLTASLTALLLADIDCRVWEHVYGPGWWLPVSTPPPDMPPAPNGATMAVEAQE